MAGDKEKKGFSGLLDAYLPRDCPQIIRKGPALRWPTVRAPLRHTNSQTVPVLSG